MKSKIFCPICGGIKTQGATTFIVDIGFDVIVVRNVLPLVCDQCGADWIAEEAAERLEKTVNDARQRHRQVEITAYMPA